MASFNGNNIFWSIPYTAAIILERDASIPSDTGDSLYLTGGGSRIYIKHGTQEKDLINGFDTIGYMSTSGVGGSVTQITSKSTGVTLNKSCGQIVTHNAILASSSVVYFVLTNSKIDYDCYVYPFLKKASGVTNGAYRVWADSPDYGTCNIYLENYSGSSLGEAVVIGFSIFRSPIN